MCLNRNKPQMPDGNTCGNTEKRGTESCPADGGIGYMVQPMNERYLTAVSAIEQESFSDAWSFLSLKNSLEDEKYRFYCLTTAGAEECVVGYAILLIVCGEGEIVRIAVDRAYREQGLGNMLLKEVVSAEKMRNTERLTLEVRESNTAAINLYRKNGFIPDGKRKNFYRKPTEDALLMSCAMI